MSRASTDVPGCDVVHRTVLKMVHTTAKLGVVDFGRSSDGYGRRNVRRPNTSLLMTGLMPLLWLAGEALAAGDPPSRFNFDNFGSAIVSVTVTLQGDTVRSGSGFVVYSDGTIGYVLTDAEAISPQASVGVVAPGSDRVVVSQVLRIDAGLDVALLKVDGLGVPPVIFSQDLPEVGDAVWSVGRWPDANRDLGMAKGHVVNLYGLGSDGAGAMVHTATFNTDRLGSVVLNACGEVIGLDMSGAPSAENVRAVDGESLKRLLARDGLRPTVASTSCVSEAVIARRQVEQASMEARRASEEAARAQEVALRLERQLAVSNQRNESLQAQAQEARDIADSAIKTAEVARTNAEETRLEMERKTATIIADTEAMMRYMERDRLAAEARFQEALMAQRDEGRTRELILLGFSLLILVLAVVGIIVLKYRSPARALAASGRQARASVPSRAGQAQAGAAAADGTELHREELTEYVLDGRDQDGIRYLLRISGDQLVNPEGVIIGRNPEDSPYIINHADVSRRHARIRVMKNRVFIEDLGSTNGTSVNGQSIEDRGPVSVDNGDQIIIGSVVMKLRVLGA